MNANRCPRRGSLTSASSDPPAADVEPALAGEFADVRPADPERGEAFREHAAAVRLGQLVAEGRDAV